VLGDVLLFLLEISLELVKFEVELFLVVVAVGVYLYLLLNQSVVLFLLQSKLVLLVF